jgi:phospholipid/cholesterol/gamma-HCH transport system substrate-binding protein
LNVQATVRFRGIRAGKVQSIGLDPKDPRSILVLIRIDDDIPVTAGTTARLNTLGVTGLAYVQLDDTGEKAEPLTAPPGDLPRIPLAGSPGETLADSASETLAQAREVLDRVGALLDERNVKRVGNTLANLEAASAGLGRAAQEIPRVLEAARRVVNEENVRRLQAILANLERTSGEAAPLAAELRALVATLQGLGGRLDALAGQAAGDLVGGTLPRANALMQELSATSRQLGRLLNELETSPEMLVFGRGPQRPGPGEPGFK